MSTKYKVHRPRAALLDRLREEWPSTLSKHDIRTARLYSCGASTIHPARVISLLRECDYTSADLLTPLYYDLSNITQHFSSSPFENSLSLLSEVELQRFIVGLSSLRSAHVSNSLCPVHVAINDTLTDPKHSAVCQYELMRSWHNVAIPKLFDLSTQMCKPIESWGVLIKIFIGGGIGNGGVRICKACELAVVNHAASTRQKLWDGLTDIFGLAA